LLNWFATQQSNITELAPLLDEDEEIVIIVMSNEQAFFHLQYMQ